MRSKLLLLAGAAFFCACFAAAQDSSSLGDIARQARAQKQQRQAQSMPATADGNSPENATAKPLRVITNESIPDHNAPLSDTDSEARRPVTATPSVSDHQAQGEQWRSQIQNQKDAIAALKREIDSVSSSVHYAGGNCIANCVAWNERQKEKQDRVELMKSQLAEQQKQLEAMQESARKQGFGSQIYDP